MIPVSVDDVEAAAVALARSLPITPAIPSAVLSEKLGCRLTLKLENFQHTGSFKERGALNKLRGLSDEARRRGV